MTKERIRENLMMLEQQLGNLNDFALTILDIEDIRAKISAWRWYVSHGYFEKGGLKPEKPCSNPPMSWLDSQLQGLSVPLSKDIATCIEPVVASYLNTEHAAKRIRDRLNMAFHYISPEDAKKDQEAAYDEHIEGPKRRKAHAEIQAAYREREKAKKDHRTPEQLEKLRQDYIKKKEKQREQFRKDEARKLKEGQERYLAEGRRLKRSGTQA